MPAITIRSKVLAFSDVFYGWGWIHGNVQFRDRSWAVAYLYIPIPVSRFTAEEMQVLQRDFYVTYAGLGHQHWEQGFDPLVTVSKDGNWLGLDWMEESQNPLPTPTESLVTVYSHMQKLRTHVFEIMGV